MSIMAKQYRGATSIFVVVFTALLITVVTVSFARLMLREQQRASNTDLAQSAYDAALAGVEDAKRALAINPNAPNLEVCNGIAPVINAPVENEGVRVGDPSLREWYSCVKVTRETVDYERKASADEVILIPLKATNPIKSLQIQWFSKSDSSTVTFSGGSAANATIPPTLDSDWDPTRPSVLEAQLIQPGSNFSLTDFDRAADGSGSSRRTHTLFLYPKQNWPDASLDLATADVQLDPISKDSKMPPTPVRCTAITTGNFSCSAVIDLPDIIEANSDTAYLRITPRYNATTVNVQGLCGNDAGCRGAPLFSGVQPRVDSTGRASDLFRRVSARVSPADGVYPVAAVDITNNFCKTFGVSANVSDYQTGECFPGN